MLSDKKSAHVLQSDMCFSEAVLLYGVPPKQLIICMELIFLTAPGKVKCFDNNQQWTAWEFTQAAKMCLDVAPQASIALNLAKAKCVSINENTHKRLHTVPDAYFSL